MKPNEPSEYHEPESRKKRAFEKWTVIDWALRLICLFIFMQGASAVRIYLNISKDWELVFLMIACFLAFLVPKLIRKRISANRE